MRPRSPAQILATILRSQDARASVERAGLPWSSAFAGLLTRARKGERARALAYITNRMPDYAARITPADILARRLKRFKPGSRGFARLAKQLGVSEPDLRALRSARSAKKRRAVYAAWERPKREIARREWPAGRVRAPDGKYTGERMTEYLTPSAGEIRYIEHSPSLPWVQGEVIWDESSYAPGVSPRTSASGGWQSSRRPADYLPGIFEAMTIIAYRAGITGPVLVRIREFSR